MTGSSKSALLVVVLAVAASAVPADDGIWTSDGLQDKDVYSLAIGEPPRTLFAVTWDGAFRSTEAGTWTQMAVQTPYALAVDPSDPETVYALTGADLFKSTDSGDHFDRLSSVSASCIAIDPAAPSTLYVGSGYSWDATTAYAGGVQKSTDGGASWSVLSTTSLTDGIATLVLDPRRPGTVYAGGSIYYDYFGYPPAPVSQKSAVIGSVDGGARWSAILGSDDGIGSVPALAVDPDTGTVYAGAGSVYRGSFDRPWARTEIAPGLNVGGVNALVIDPAIPTTLYAGTKVAGVFRSLDGGATWAPMNDGLFSNETLGYSGLWINSLVLDPADGVLRAGTANGVFAIRPGVPSPPCTPAAAHLCLLGGRYRATVMAQNPRTFVVTGGVVIQEADRFGGFSLPDFTGDAEFPEVFVKMVDPGGNRGAWVFHGGLTSLPYVLSITDTATGRMETYTNDSQNRFCGGADTAAFLDDASGVPAHAAFAATNANGWMPDNGTLHLLNGRFRLSLTASSSRLGRTEPGIAQPRTDRYGYFSLPGFTGDASFPEVFVKMVDFTSITREFLLFHTGLTGLDYTLTVGDTVTGVERTFEGTGDFCGGAVALPAR